MFDPSVTLSNLPIETYRQLQAEAQRNGRTMEDEAVERLKQSLGEGGVRFGTMKGKLGNAPDFSEPMTEDELAAWEGRDFR